MIFPFSYAYLYSSAGVSFEVKITLFLRIPLFLDRINSDKDEQSKIDINRAKYYNDIMRLKKEGTLVNAGELGEDMLSTVWTALHKLIFDKLLIEGERRTLTLYTKDGLKSFDMYEGVWWLDQFMHEQFDNKDNIRRKDRDI